VTATLIDNKDPWQILGVPPEANDEQVRQAYLAQVKAFPPDRCGDEFQRIRWAYDELKDTYRRTKHLILGADPQQPLCALLEKSAPLKQVGPQPWLEALRGLRPKD
jgi:curved DNA-binding protein CbpA